LLQLLPQLEKNHEISQSSPDEALLFLQDLKSNPEFPLKGLTPFRSLKGLQEIPVATGEESRVLCFNSR